MAETTTQDRATLFGHPTGLFTLFFAEMWERFSYYGMRALLLFYMLKGFLGYSDSQAYTVYGSYTALVYMTPFFGGALADRLLGARRAVVLGGLLMAGGHLLMTVQSETAFFGALALLIAGNGFFKPNISTMVGTLYPEGSVKRDSGFTIFYMGINLGAAMSPLLCGYIGETYGWHYGFGLATLGMLTGIAVFVAPLRVTQLVIASGAVSAALALFILRPDNAFSFATNIFVAVALLGAAGAAWVALGRGGLPKEAGAAPDLARLQKPTKLGLSTEWTIYLGALLAVPVFAIMVARLDVFTGWVLAATGVAAIAFLLRESLRLPKVQRERMFVVLILTFFSMLFWSFFEQAGSSMNNFADRNVDRVTETRAITQADIGETLRITPTQEQVGHHNGALVFTLSDLDRLRAEDTKGPDFQIEWTVAPDNIGMGVAERRDEVPASVFQAVNPVFILLFGLLFSALWSYLGTRGWEPSTPLKFSLGLLQLGLGFGALWYGAQVADGRGMVAAFWLVLAYLLHTTGELCLSPVGLSMVTRLSPKQLVSTVMGMWFLATAFSQYLAAIISKFTGVSGEEGSGKSTPVPLETLHVYGEVFGKIAIAAMLCAGISLLLVPLLKRFMHEGEPA